MTCEININEWSKFPVYGGNIKELPDSKGVYLIICEGVILYIGQSTSIRYRFRYHDVLRVLKKVYSNLEFYYVLHKNPLIYERVLIKTINPKFNSI